MTAKRKILIADDDASIRTVLSHALSRAGFAVEATDNPETLYGWAREGRGDLVITDVMMPGGNGLDLLPRLKKARPDLKIIVISAQNTFTTAMTAAERGALDCLPKPFDLDELVSLVNRALVHQAVEQNNAPATDDNPVFIGRSLAMQPVYRTIARLMNSDMTVLITGESGTGKEIVARALHASSRWKTGPFIAVNMAAMPHELIESELFGHEKGAFTGATGRHSGKFEQARGGTLFLDEIGDMPLEAQTRLLRVIQEGEFTTVGGHKTIKAEARIIAATHRNLPALVREGRFREDLYYRLNVVPLRVPPLRERIEDVPDLARHFLKKQGDGKVLSAEALIELKKHSWPGNVRELENLMHRVFVLCPEDTIGSEVLAREIAMNSEGDGRETLSAVIGRMLDGYVDLAGENMTDLHRKIVNEVERPLLQRVLAATGGNQIRASAILGLNRNTLRKKIRELGVKITRNGGGA